MSVEEAATAKTSWSTHDPACKNCRARKIRCGRERPRCANCERDDAHCDFSSSGKRVNHTKLLVNNFSGLEQRLDSIEKKLESLLDTIQNGEQKVFHHINRHGPYSSPRELDMIGLEDCHPTSFSDEQQSGPCKQQPVDRYVVRCQADLSDRYHGPCTLLALCNEFYDQLMKTQSDNALRDSQLSDDDIVRKETINSLLTTMCSSVGYAEPIELHHENLPILLPPRQFLLMACAHFFQQEDPAVDLFCQSTFWANVDRIYSNTCSQTDDAWALCFNIIILLVLGAERPGFGGDGITRWQFAMPFISAVRRALSCPSVFMAPKLINVQALALLSVVAQQYLQPSFTEVILSQACVLAKIMGLHQQYLSPDRHTSKETKERWKVFRSLFIRDKSLTISRGISCLLPTLDCGMSITLNKTGLMTTNMCARIQLAGLQEEIYRALHSTESLRQSTAQRNAARLKTEDGLRRWAEAHSAMGSAELVPPIDLQLEFLASRIVALRSSSDIRHMEQVVHDARRSCRLLVDTAGTIEKCSPTHAGASQRGPLLKGLASCSLFRPGNSSPESQSVPASAGNNSPLVIRSLVDNFSVPAFFALVKNIIWPVTEDNSERDLEPLEAVNQLFIEMDYKSQVNNYTSKVSRTFQRLLAIVEALKSELFHHHQQPQHQEQRPRGYEFQQQQHHRDGLYRDEKQRYDHDATQTSPTNHTAPTSPTNFSNTTPPMSYFASFDSLTPPSSKTNSSGASSFEPTEPLIYDTRSHWYSLSPQPEVCCQERNPKRQRLMSRNTPNEDYYDDHHSSYITSMSSMLPFGGEQQDAISDVY